MKKNVGVTDRIIRTILAIGVGYFAYSTTFETSWLPIVLYVFSAIMFLTTFAASCPLYSIFKMDTCKYN